MAVYAKKFPAYNDTGCNIHASFSVNIFSR